MRAILLYNLFPKTIWKDLTRDLLQNAPHDTIVVHVTIPRFAWLYKWPFKWRIKKHLKQYPKIEKVIFSKNVRKEGESVGFNKLRQSVSFEDHNIVTYIHSKGASRRRKNTKPIQDWTAMMRYFVIERLDLCKIAFSKGYYLYGADLTTRTTPDHAKVFPDITFHYSGNFVSLNLDKLRKEFLSAECKKNYYGVEFFWGGLCEIEKAYCVHNSNTDHYSTLYPASNYVTTPIEI